MNADDIRCTRCGQRVHTGEARIAVALTANNLAELIHSTIDPELRNRLLCALGLIDAEREKELR